MKKWTPEYLHQVREELAKAQADRWVLMEALKNLLGQCENFGPHAPDIEAAMVNASDVIRAVGGWDD
jgi:predicted nuclease of restriction endonuclease-like RecB superfamily